MVRDYIRSGLAEPPVEYARNYYLHLPVVAIGHWPPVFYAFLGGWMSLAGTSRGAALALIAILTALLAATIIHETSKRTGPLIGWLCGILFLLLPIVRWHTRLVMVDIAVALFGFWALLALMDYIKTERRRSAIVFGILSAITLLTKANGAFLALLVPLALLVCGRLAALKKKDLWLAAGIVLLACGPWYWYVSPVLHTGVISAAQGWSSLTVEKAVHIAWQNGLPVLIVAVVSLILLWRRDADVRLLAAGAGAVLCGQALWPVGAESRYFLPALPPVIVLTGVGVDLLSRRISANYFRPLSMTAMGVLIAAVGFTPERTNFRPNDSLRQVIADIQGSPHLNQGRILVVSRARENAMVAEFAGADPVRPRRMVIRATKLLSRCNWFGGDYVLLTRTVDEVLTTLEESGVGLIVFDLRNSSRLALPHFELVRAGIHSRSWPVAEIREYPQGSRSPDFLLVHLASPPSRPLPSHIRSRLLASSLGL
jgi:hypothetical protein